MSATVADVHALPDDGKRYEVIDGALFVTPLVSGRRPESFSDVKRLLLAAEVLSPATR